MKIKKINIVPFPFIRLAKKLFKQQNIQFWWDCKEMLNVLILTAFFGGQYGIMFQKSL